MPRCSRVVGRTTSAVVQAAPGSGTSVEPHTGHSIRYDKPEYSATRLQRDQCRGMSHTQSAPRVARRHAAIANPPDSTAARRTHPGYATQAPLKLHNIPNTSAGAALASAPCAR